MTLCQASLPDLSNALVAEWAQIPTVTYLYLVFLKALEMSAGCYNKKQGQTSY